MKHGCQLIREHRCAATGQKRQTRDRVGLKESVGEASARCGDWLQATKVL
jgi:hypothetical protein